MDEQEVLAALAKGKSAQALLKEHVPDAQRRFRLVCNTMSKLLKDVRKEFPDATYYTERQIHRLPKDDRFR